MASYLELAIKDLHKELHSYELKVKQLKESINQLSVVNNQPPPFKDVENVPLLMSITNIRADAFFGKPFATAVGEFLKMKNEPATAEEVLDALERGGFEFPDTWKDKLRLKNVAISLSKNRDKFIHFKSNKSFGLIDFYPDRKKEKEKSPFTEEVYEVIRKDAESLLKPENIVKIEDKEKKLIEERIEDAKEQVAKIESESVRSPEVKSEENEDLPF